MSKKNVFLLRSFVVILLVIIFITSVYYYFHKKIIDFYSPDDMSDIFLSTMDSEQITTFDSGDVLVTGEFLQNDNVYENRSFFVKSYHSSGKINNIGSLELPVGYSLADTLALDSSVVFLYASEQKKSGEALIFEISDDGTLLSSYDVKVDTSPNRSKELFLVYENDAVNYAVIIGNVFYVYNAEHIIVNEFNITPDIKINDVICKNDSYILAGRIKNDNGYNAYYTAYSKKGELIYSINTMNDTPSFAEKIIYRPHTDDNFYFITGYYFNAADYIKNKGDLPQSELFEIGEKSLRMIEPGVLLSSSYMSDPWPSFFILKVNADGTIISSVSPIEATQNTGISEVNYVNMSCVNASASYPVLCFAEAIAPNTKSESYTLSVYSLNSDLTYEYSSGILMNSDIRNKHVVNPDGSISVFTELNKKYDMKMHKYNSIIDYAKELRNITFYYRIIEFIESCFTKLPMIAVYVILIISTKYRIWDYLGKKKIIDKWTI